MKKMFLLIFVFVTFRIFPFNFLSDLDYGHYKGNVKQIINKYYEVSNAKSKLKSTSISYFNKEGNYEKIEFYDINKKIVNYEIYIYNKNNRKVIDVNENCNGCKICEKSAL